MDSDLGLNEVHCWSSTFIMSTEIKWWQQTTGVWIDVGDRSWRSNVLVSSLGCCHRDVNSSRSWIWCLQQNKSVTNITFWHIVNKKRCQQHKLSPTDVRLSLVADQIFSSPISKKFWQNLGGWRVIWWCLLYSEMRLSYLSNSFGNEIYLILSSGSKCFEMETKHLLVELFSWLQNPKTSFRIPQFLLAG